jgi:hypothetical protein
MLNWTSANGVKSLEITQDTSFHLTYRTHIAGVSRVIWVKEYETLNEAKKALTRLKNL